MESEIAVCDRAVKRKKHRRSVLTLPYEPMHVEVDCLVEGDEIKKIREKAGYKTQESFAGACEWSQSSQCKYEKSGVKRIPLIHVFKIIRVCNGGS